MRTPCTTSRHAALLVALVAPLLTAADIGHLHLPVNATGGLQIDSSAPTPPTLWAASAWLNYAYQPLLWRYSDHSYEAAIAHQLGLDVVGNVGLLPWLDVGVDLPVLLRQGGGNGYGLGVLSGTALGDVQLVGRAGVLPQRIFGTGLAAMLHLSLPTGSRAQLVGNGAVAFSPAVVAERAVGPVTVRGKLAYRWQQSTQLAGMPLGDAFDLAVGASLPLWAAGWPLVVLAEASATTGRLAGFTAATSAVELQVGGRTRLAGLWDATVGASWGLGGALGVPTARVLLGISARPEAADRDHDGVPDVSDACPTQPEDYNGYADLDGCPDAAQIKEPPAPPPPPPPPPPPDTDHDGIPDHEDQCPAEPETINGIDDRDGCPDVGEGATEYRPQVAIELKKTIQFETGKAVIKPESFPVLDQVALQLLAHQEVLKVRVEGHTDSVGRAEGNLKLSQARADAVRTYLVERAVNGGRLEAVGFGETQPIDTNDTPEGRANNRRVTFIILQTAPRP